MTHVYEPQIVANCKNRSILKSIALLKIYQVSACKMCNSPPLQPLPHTIFWESQIFWTNIFLTYFLFRTNNLSDPDIFWTQHFFRPRMKYFDPKWCLENWRKTQVLLYSDLLVLLYVLLRIILLKIQVWFLVNFF